MVPNFPNKHPWMKTPMCLCSSKTKISQKIYMTFFEICWRLCQLRGSSILNSKCKLTATTRWLDMETKFKVFKCCLKYRMHFQNILLCLKGFTINQSISQIYQPNIVNRF